MVRITREALQRWLAALVHVQDTPRRTAAAFAVGVFFGFSPFLGLHTVLGLAVAFALGLNRAAVLVGVYSNVPWIIAAYYAFATAAGATLLGVTPSSPLLGQVRTLVTTSAFDLDLAQLTALFRPLFWPYMLGSTIGALLLAGIAYAATLAIITRRAALRVGAPVAPASELPGSEL